MFNSEELLTVEDIQPLSDEFSNLILFEVHNIECPISGPFAELEYSESSLTFQIFPEDEQSDIITLSNIGQEGSTLNYSMGVSPFENTRSLVPIVINYKVLLG